jgi:hypothetical protein
MLKKRTWNVGSGHRRSSGREAHTLTGWTSHAAIINMLESGLSLPDRMLDQVADFRRAERFLPASFGEPTRLIPTRAFSSEVDAGSREDNASDRNHRSPASDPRQKRKV